LGAVDEKRVKAPSLKRVAVATGFPAAEGAAEHAQTILDSDLGDPGDSPGSPGRLSIQNAE